MRSSLLFLCALLSLFPAVSAGSDDLMGLYLLARERDPVLGRAHAQVEVSRAEKQMVAATLLPRLDAGAGINWVSNETLFYQPEPISGSFTGYSYNVTLRQPLMYLPGVYNLRAAHASLEGADAAARGARQELILTLSEAYFSLLKARADEGLYREEINRFEVVLQQAEAYIRQGAGDIIAVHEARSRLDGAKADLVKAANSRAVAQQKLTSLVGRPVSELKDLGELEPAVPSPAELAWWLDTMVQKNPALSQGRAGVRQTEEERKGLAAGYLPTIQLSGGYSVSKGSTFLPDVETRQWSVGLSMSLSIFAGGDTRARVRRARATEKDQRYALDYAVEQATQKLKDAFLKLEYSSHLIRALQQKKSSAEVQLKAVTKGRSIGTRTNVDVLDAEQTFAASSRDLNAALYDNALYALQLKGAAGILSEEDLAGVNARLAGEGGATLTVANVAAVPQEKGGAP